MNKNKNGRVNEQVQHETKLKQKSKETRPCGLKSSTSAWKH